MEDQNVDFVKQFHTLQGDTIDDRKKNFNKLMQDPIFSKNKQQIHDALSTLKPRTYLENLFLVDALIHFRFIPRLLDILKDGNEVFISKILKQSWFWQEAFSDMEANHLVNDFLPNLSFSIRIKVLKRLGLVLNENKMDDIFICIYKRYGIWEASKIVHTCSKDKIKSVFKSEDIILRANQVLHLFNRDIELFEMYLDYYKNITGNTFFEPKLIQHGVLKNPQLLLRLQKEEKIVILKLGRRTSKKTYALLKDKISQEFDEYSSILNNAVLVKKMGSDFKNVYLKKFPRKIEDINLYSDCVAMLKNYPKNKRWEIFSQTFQIKFPDKDINECYQNLEHTLIMLKPGREIVLKWADNMYKKQNDEKFLKFLQPSMAIPIIKEKINVTSDIYKRNKLVTLLFETCEQNKDLAALEEVLKYVCSRHRNEDINFRQNILTYIDASFQLDKLNKTHWQFINEQLKIMKVKNEFSFWRFSAFSRRYLEFLVKADKDVKESLYEYVTYTFIETNSFLFELKNPVVERKLIVETIQIFPDALKTDKKIDIRHCYLAFINSIIKFSEEYPDHYIDIGEYNYLVAFLNNEIKRNSEYDVELYRVVANVLRHKQRFSQSKLFPNELEIVEIASKFCKYVKHNAFNKYIQDSILKKNRNNLENKLLELYFETIYEKNPESSIINWLLKHDPKVLIPHFKKICTKYPALDSTLLKRYSHFNFDTEAASMYKERLVCDNFDYRVEVVETLRNLLPASEFASIIDEKFIPKKSKLDLDDVDMVKVYNFQCDIAKKLCKVEEPLKVISVVLKFCTGDYWQAALPSLQSVLYNSPEKEIYCYITQLLNKADSVRKHAVFFGCELLKRELIIDLLTTTNVANVSNQKHLFSATLKYFRKNPSQELLDLVVKNMSTIDKNDTETLENLVKTDVPKKYKGFYIKRCWDFYESLKNDGVNVDKYLINLLETVVKHTDVLVFLPITFLEHIINNYFCTSVNSNIIGKFIIHYMIQVENFRDKFIVKVLKKLSYEKKYQIREFMDCIREATLTREFFIVFAKYWNEHFTYVDAFEENIEVNLILIEILGQNVAENIINYMEDILDKFTFNAFNLFIEVFGNFVARKLPNEQYELLYDLVKTKPNAHVCIMVLETIHPIDDNEHQHFELYQSIIECIKKIQDPIVTIYYKRLLANNNLE